MLNKYIQENDITNMKPYDLMFMIKNDELAVSGSESYNSNFGPEEACNPSASVYRMFGGVIR